jgi:4-hydroxybenzoate polyprenyltransferase/phosphoserine phosphatase
MICSSIFANANLPNSIKIGTGVHVNLFPLVIDLDGTLLRSDLLLESSLTFFRSQPLRILLPFKWLAFGKAYLKEQLAKVTSLDVANLPYDSQVIKLIEQEKLKGRKIILATASHKIYADQIASHLNLFDRVFATEGKINLSAFTKRDLLVNEFGKQGFDYVGNSYDDLPVLQAARKAYLVNPERGMKTEAQTYGNVERIFDDHSVSLKTWARALRLHQWLKNLLIFVPLLASHQVTNLHLILKCLCAFLLFGLCASSVYLLNDLLDLADDRHHRTKRYRPFASGQLSIQSGLVIFPTLLFLAFFHALCFLPWKFSLALGVYFVLTLMYSFALKKRMVADVIALAMLYTLRMIAGVFVCSLNLTFWMLAFSMFIFLSLALVKRYAELLTESQNKAKMEKTRGRGYCPDDLQMISSLGAASGYLSVMVLALYIQDQSIVSLYKHPKLIWLACPLLLYWISRTWLLTHRGQMHDDPIVFAMKDRMSLFVAVLFGVIFWLAV